MTATATTLPQWAEWQGDPAHPYTVGVEEEVMLLDGETLDLRPDGPAVLAATGHDKRFTTELPAAQLEIVLPDRPMQGRRAVRFRRVDVDALSEKRGRDRVVARLGGFDESKVALGGAEADHGRQCEQGEERTTDLQV